ncbi:MAG: hypothetical protein RMK20_13080, partial [Verrucomicrobiales bacterium]|nr:hypothetical protein [Verrucomicrobiales bacterium]
MAEDNKFNGEDKNLRKGGEFPIPPRTWLVWMAIIAGIVALVSLKGRLDSQGEIALSQHDFFRKVDSNLIAKVTINYGGQGAFLREIRGTFYETDNAGNIVKDARGRNKEIAFRTKARLTEALENKLLALPQVEPYEPNPFLYGFGLNLLFLLVIVLFVWFFFIRQLRLAGKGALNFGKSKARLLTKERNKTTFKDVAGIDEAIEEVAELVEFLR